MSWKKIIQPLSPENGGQETKSQGSSKFRDSNNYWPSTRTKRWSIRLRERLTSCENYLTSLMAKKEFNQPTSRVPLQPLIQSSAAVTSGHVYNFHNCNVLINQGHANATSSLQSSINNESATMLKRQRAAPISVPHDFISTENFSTNELTFHWRNKVIS